MGKSKKINSWLVKGKNTGTLLRVTADILVKRIGREKSDGQIENDGEREEDFFKPFLCCTHPGTIAVERARA